MSPWGAGEPAKPPTDRLSAWGLPLLGVAVGALILMPMGLFGPKTGTRASVMARARSMAAGYVPALRHGRAASFAAMGATSFATPYDYVKCASVADQCP